MRPDPQQSRHDVHSGRIIYLGDVRKRRARNRRNPDRSYLIALSLTALVLWAAWLGFVMTVAPSKLLSYIAFFAPLSGALITTCAIAFYAVDWRRGMAPSLRVCLRRGVLATAVIVLNLSCLGARFWMLPIAVVSIAAAVMIEIALMARRAGK